MRAVRYTIFYGLLTCAPATFAQSVDSTIAALQSRLPDLIDAAEIPGIVIAVVDSGEVVWEGAYGVASADSREPVGTRTVFEAASLSKPVAAIVALRLAERGEFDLDRPLHEYLPNDRMEHDSRYRQITARRVLSHSSGLPNWGGDQLDLEFDPGARFQYSGEGYVYLQRVLESVTGRPFAELAKTEVFDPLGLDRTSFVWMDAFESDHASGHDAIGRPQPINRPTDTNAAASLLTTAGDYGSFLAAVLTRRNLRPEVAAAMMAPVVDAHVPWSSGDASDAVQWGLGWGIERDVRLIWHWGDNGDFEAFVAGDPETGRGFVYFANSTFGLSIAEDVAETVFGRKVWGPSWAGYDRHDDPTRVAVRTMFHRFQEDGVEAGLHALANVDTSTVSLAVLARHLANLLGEAGNGDASVVVLERAVDALPAAGDLHEDLANAYLRAGRFEDALASFRTLEGDYAPQIQWIEQRITAESPRLGEADLKKLTGDYGPRHVTFENGELFYERDGNPRYRLIPITDTLFRLDGLETFRLRFTIGDGDRTATKIVGLYMDGSSDETPRSE